MDAGNWSTNIAAGSAFEYQLLFVILLSSIIAMLLQALSLRLGMATGRDLAQACRDTFSPRTNYVLWATAEIAIIATDLAEVIGTAIALKLLFGLPLEAGVAVTAVDVLIVMWLQNRKFRLIEALVIALIVTIIVCFSIELGLCKPNGADVMAGFLPSTEIVTNTDALLVSIGIIGATVMPHNLYLHSSIVQTRACSRDPSAIKEAIKWLTVDSCIALTFALYVNAAILIVAAATFYQAGDTNIQLLEDGKLF
jgi:manganese transport protein